jgi:ParB family chromosome partitioning protein
MVRKLIENKPLQQQEPSREDPDIVRLQESLSERIGARVEIQHTNKGSGKLTLRYNSLDELDGILAHIK